MSTSLRLGFLAVHVAEGGASLEDALPDLLVHVVRLGRGGGARAGLSGGATLRLLGELALEHLCGGTRGLDVALRLQDTPRPHERAREGLGVGGVCAREVVRVLVDHARELGLDRLVVRDLIDHDLLGGRRRRRLHVGLHRLELALVALGHLLLELGALALEHELLNAVEIVLRGGVDDGAGVLAEPLGALERVAGDADRVCSIARPSRSMSASDRSGGRGAPARGRRRPPRRARRPPAARPRARPGACARPCAGARAPDRPRRACAGRPGTSGSRFVSAGSAHPGRAWPRCRPTRARESARSSLPCRPRRTAA